MNKKNPDINAGLKAKSPPVANRSKSDDPKLSFQQAAQEGVIETHVAIARSFGVSARTVRNWAQDGMPKMRDGRYSIADIQAWRFANQNKRKEKKGSSNDDKKRLEKFKALTAEAEYNKMMGGLIDRSTVERELILISQAVKQALLGIPRALAKELEMQPARVIEARLKTKMNEVLDKFSTGTIFENSNANGKTKKIKDPGDLFAEGA